MKLLRAIRNLGRSRSGPELDCGCPEGLPDGDPAFAAAVTALGAKLAKADGRADDAEFESFLEVFAPEEAAIRDVLRVYRLARQTTLGFEGYAKELTRRYRRCPQTLEKVLGGLFHIAQSDGVVSADELAFLEAVGGIFGLSALTVRRVRAECVGLAAGDPYGVLGVAPDAPDETVRAAWKKALSANHPDRAMGRGLSQDLIEAAHAKAAAINAAFEAVMHERRTLATSAV